MSQELIRADCIIPAPMMSEIKRQELVEKYKLGTYANGCVIEKEWRVHNPVFDKKGEKTTTMLRIRPAKDDSEVAFILAKLEQV